MSNGTVFFNKESPLCQSISLPTPVPLIQDPSRELAAEIPVLMTLLFSSTQTPLTFPPRMQKLMNIPRYGCAKSIFLNSGLWLTLVEENQL